MIDDDKGFALDGYEDYNIRNGQADDRLRARMERQRREAEEKKKQNGDYCVPFVTIRCPKCDSDKITTYKTDRPVRYHKCTICKTNFKSVE